MKVEHVRIKTAVLIAFAAVCGAIFLYLFTAAGGNLRLSAPYSFTASVPDAFQLVPQSDVRRAGVKIGRVTGIESNGRSAQVRVEISDPDQAPIYRDARLLVRTKTLVGENYLDLEPGTPGAGELADNGNLPVENSEDAVQLDQILSSLDKETRESVRRNLRETGAGFGPAGDDLNRLFGAARPAVDNGARLMSILNAQRTEVAALIENTGIVLDTIGQRSSDVRTLAGAAKVTAQTVADRDEQLRETLGAIAPTLEQARSTTDVLAAFSGRATPVIRDLRLAAGHLTPVVRDLEPTALSARRLVAELPAALDEVDPLLARLPTFTAAARPVIPQLDRLLDELTPAVQYLSTYNNEVGSFFANVGSMNGIRDAVGQIGRVHAQIAPGSFGSLTPAAQDALDLLLAADVVTRTRSEAQNSYPVPGSIGAPTLESNFRRVTSRGRN